MHPIRNAMMCSRCHREIGDHVWQRFNGYGTFHPSEPLICTSCHDADERTSAHEARRAGYDWQPILTSRQHTRTCTWCERTRHSTYTVMRGPCCPGECTRLEQNRRRRHAPSLTALTCEHCAARFTSRRASARYCRSACRQAAYRDRAAS